MTEASDEAAEEARSAPPEAAAGTPGTVDAPRENSILPRFPNTEES